MKILSGIISAVALFLCVLAGCSNPRSPESLVIRSEPAGTPKAVGSITPPDVLHIINTDRESILDQADVIFDWDGFAKFGNTYVKHKGRWYGAGGFIGNADDFIRNEVKITGGTVVFASNGYGHFNESKYGPSMCEYITRGHHEGWRFFYIEKETFHDFPSYRDYYDTQNKKILYRDYNN